jgi:hypothetical protein
MMTFSMAGRIRWWNNGAERLQISCKNWLIKDGGVDPI